MASSFKISDLAAELQRNIADVITIFGLKMVNGFDLKGDGTFTVLPCKDKVPLVRDEIAPILQPGRTGTTNYTNDVVALKSRMGVKTPFKFDLKLDEVTLYAWSNAYLANKKPTDPTDIYSLLHVSFLQGHGSIAMNPYYLVWSCTGTCQFWQYTRGSQEHAIALSVFMCNSA